VAQNVSPFTHAAPRHDRHFVVAIVLALVGIATSGTTAPHGASATAVSAAAAPPLRSFEPRTFGSCHSGGGIDCVVDGDTFWMAGEKIRIADIDAPETHPARCDEEARLGAAATARLQALLNAGPIELAMGARDTDRYGRKLRIVMRDKQSLGETMVRDGLARRWEGRRRPWCADAA